MHMKNSESKPIQSFNPDFVVFEFEKEFVEEQIRCIPMIIRFKLDIAGIKLSLAQWSSFAPEERNLLATLPCNHRLEKERYEASLQSLLKRHGWGEAERLDGLVNAQLGPDLYDLVNSRANGLGHRIEPEQWEGLSVLQRFALGKLIRPGHESKNFVPALREFGLMHQTLHP